MSEPCGRLRQFDLALAVVTKAFAIVAGCLAFYLFVTGQHDERKRVVIEEVFRAKSPEVLRALTRLDQAFRDRRLDYPDLVLDVSTVIVWYDHLGLLWLRDPYLDKCVIKAAVEPYTSLMASVLDAVNYPPERQIYFNLLRNKMPDHKC